MDFKGIQAGLVHAARKGMSFVEEKIAPSVNGFVDTAKETAQDKIIPGVKEGFNTAKDSISMKIEMERKYKEAFELLNRMNSCNNCIDRSKECCPKWGEQARYNCYWWSGEENIRYVSDSPISNKEDAFRELPMSNRRRNLQ